MDNKEYQDVLQKHNITVTAEFIANVVKKWGDDKTTEKRPQYKITVSDDKGVSVDFDFWGSIMDYYKSKSLPMSLSFFKSADYQAIRVLFPFGMPSNIKERLRKHNREMQLRERSKEYLIDAAYGAFNCILSDAISGDDTFDMFCDSFGYDNDSRKAETIYRECQTSLDKLRTVISCDLYDLANSLER